MAVAKSEIEKTPNYTVSKEGFEWFCSIMKEWNFQKIGSKQIIKDFTRLDLQKRIRKVEGYETGFIYSSPNSPYSVKVWVTYLEKEEKFRDVGTDAAWVILVTNDELDYSAKPFKRNNSEFFLSLARYAWISKWKIDNPPLCPCKTCEKEMQIHRKKGTRQYFWMCIAPNKHENPTFRSWDYGLGDKAKDFLSIRREKTKKYKEKNKKLGKNPTPAAVLRKKRQVGRPENLKK